MDNVYNISSLKELGKVVYIGSVAFLPLRHKLRALFEDEGPEVYYGFELA
jgi:hypothetical protein